MKYFIGIIGRSCHKYHFCHNKSFVATKVLSQQKFACHNKTFVPTKLCFVVTKYFCHDKHKSSVMTSTLLLWQKVSFVMTNTYLLQHTYFCRDKVLVATKLCLPWQNFCHDKICFVMTNTCLSQQNFRCNKNVPMIHFFINKTDTKMKNWHAWSAVSMDVQGQWTMTCHYLCSHLCVSFWSVYCLFFYLAHSLLSSGMWLWMRDCSFTQSILNSTQVVYLQHCLVVTWLVPPETAAILAHILWTPYSHAPVCNVIWSHICRVHVIFVCLAVTCHLHF